MGGAESIIYMRNILKKIYYIFKSFRLSLLRKYGKVFNRFKKFKNSYSFVILCVKKTAYADMAIVNINSLHALNPTHKFHIYCDTICADYLHSRTSSLDYPNMINMASLINRGNITK
jgi:hypothetical protein